MTDTVWPTDAASAIAIQKSLVEKVRAENDFEKMETVAGIDVSYDLDKNISRGVVVFMTIKELRPLQAVVEYLPTAFPYIPGLLSFREVPVILKALEKLPEKPDLLMVDGQGIAHPRRLGIAAHLGIITDMPSIGVGKSRLTGSFTDPGPRKGDKSVLLDKAEKIGTVLRSRESTLPIFVSPGHRINHDTAVDITMQCLTKYRLPEPTRIADKISKMKEDSYGLF